MRTLGIGIALALSGSSWAADVGADAAEGTSLDAVAPEVTSTGADADAAPTEASAPKVAVEPAPARVHDAPARPPAEAPVSLVVQAPLDRAQASLHAEADAMSALVAVLKKEVREGRLDLSNEAKLAWQAGVADFANVEERADVGDWSTAWLAAIQARTVVLRGADEAFSVRTADPVKVALQDYLDAVEPRVEATRQLIRLHNRVDLEKRWIEARELFQQAKTHASVERLGKAWGALVVSSGKLDQLVLQTVWDWHPDAD